MNFQGVGRKWKYTQSLSSVVSRSRTLETTRSFGMPYGWSPWKGTAASFFVPWILLPLVRPSATSVVSAGMAKILGRCNGRAYVRYMYHGLLLEKYGPGSDIRAWGSGYVTSNNRQALGFVHARLVYPSTV